MPKLVDADGQRPVQIKIGQSGKTECSAKAADGKLCIQTRWLFDHHGEARIVNTHTKFASLIEIDTEERIEVGRGKTECGEISNFSFFNQKVAGRLHKICEIQRQTALNLQNIITCFKLHSDCTTRSADCFVDRFVQPVDAD